MRNFLKERREQLGKELLPKSEKILAEIKPLLANHGALLQGAVIAELAAIWIGGHAPEIREEMNKIFFETVESMISLHDPWAEK
jgi:hypothetical protein